MHVETSNHRVQIKDSMVIIDEGEEVPGDLFVCLSNIFEEEDTPYLTVNLYTKKFTPEDIKIIANEYLKL